MNRNKIVWIQTVGAETGRRHCYLVTSPSLEDAQNCVREWMDDEDELIDSHCVLGIVDIDERRGGKTEIIMHN